MSDDFDQVRDELRHAVWWARSWSLAYLWRERRINPRTRDMIESRTLEERTVLRATRVKISNLQSWRVFKHEKQAWSRLEWLVREPELVDVDELHESHGARRTGG